MIARSTRLMVLLAALWGSTLATEATDPPGPRHDGAAPLIESWAPGVFDGDACPTIGTGTVSYRVDATVLMPLVFTAVPIASRSNVGAAAFTAYDCAQIGAGRLRAFEFFARSFPERARGLNRLGFLREVVRLTAAGPEGTAHFGVVSSTREESVEDAKRALDHTIAGQRYSFISGIIAQTEASNAVQAMTLVGSWASAGDLYRTVRPVWGTEPPSYVRTIPNDRHQNYQSPVGFLGSLETSLRRVAMAVADGKGSLKPSVAYVHNGHVYHLDVSTAGRDADRARDYAAQGLVQHAGNVWQIGYRIVADTRKEVETFAVWVELPTRSPDDAFTPPITPLAFQFRPRSFLELRAVRTAPAALPGSVGR